MRATVTALALIAVCAAACSSAAQPSASPMASTNPPTTPPASAPTATPPPTLPGEIPTPPTSRFEEALSYLLPDDKLFNFNDWAAIKESLGAEDVTGASSEEDKRRVLVEGLNSPPHPASPRPGSTVEAIVDGYGARVALTHGDVWGFDVFDYEWEAAFGEAPTHVIRFREGFDLAPVMALFDEREFTSERLEGATLRMHEPSGAFDWMLDLAIFNVALLDDGRTMLLSYDPDSLRAHLATFKPDQTAAVSSVGEAVGEPWAATIVLDGANFCQSISPSADSSAADLLETAGPLGAWDAMAFAYSREVSPIGRIAFAYEDEGQAQSDLEGRRLLAEEGTSLYEDGPPYAYYFAVEDAEAAEGVVQLLVSPANDWPGHLFTPVYVRDLLFAACPD